MRPGVVVYKDGLEGVIVSRDDINHLVSRILVESDYACRWYWIYEWSEKPAQVSEEYVELFL